MAAAVRRLRLGIATGTWSPGDRLPAEADLCVRLDVSRTSLREAIRILETLGVLETRHGSGTYVSTLEPATLIRGLALATDLLPLSGVLELMEVRRVLEGACAGQAAARATDEDMSALADLVRRMEAEPDASAYSEIDHRFHMVVARLSGNASLASFVEVMRGRSRHYQMFDSVHAEAIRRESDAGHRRILEAVLARDPLTATAAAQDHVLRTQIWLRTLAADLHPSHVDALMGERVHP